MALIAIDDAAHICVMGVSGVGKSTVGRELANRLGRKFVDADDLHPQANVAKMSSGIPLTDADRGPWLDAVVSDLDGQPAPVVFACSALTRRYRDHIARAQVPVYFVHLTADPAELRRRLIERTGHFMGVGMLDSQLATLEPIADDEYGASVTSGRTVSETVELVIEKVCPEGDLNPHAR